MKISLTNIRRKFKKLRTLNGYLIHLSNAKGKKPESASHYLVGRINVTKKIYTSKVSTEGRKN